MSMTVGDYLRVPYLVTAQSVPKPDGSWVRHVEHPELPDCTAESDSLTDALHRLDVRRIEVVLGLLDDGRRPPVAPALLGAVQARQRAERAGLADRVAGVWDTDVDPS